MKRVFYDNDPYLGGKEIATYQVLKHLNDKENTFYAYTGSINEIIKEKVEKYATLIDLNTTGDVIECDVAIFCSIWHYTKQIVAKEKRILWVHGLNPDHKSAIYTQTFDDIVYVSETTKRFYENKIPHKGNVHVIYNIVDLEELITKSNEFYPIKKGRDLTLCTVSRLSFEKGVKKIQFIASMLSRSNLHYTWYVIGGSKDEKYKQELRDLLKHYPNIYLMGEMENPNKIVKHCDFIVQLSNLETQNLAVLDAKLLGVKAILSDIPAFREFYPNEIFTDMGYGHTLMKNIKDSLKEPKKEYVYKDNRQEWNKLVGLEEKIKIDPKVETKPKPIIKKTTKVTKSKPKKKGVK